MPENDRLVLISQHDAVEFDYDPSYLGIARSDDLVIAQITCNSGRGETGAGVVPTHRLEFYADLDLRPEDALINLIKLTKENWSFESGVAPYTRHNTKLR